MCMHSPHCCTPWEVLLCKVRTCSKPCICNAQQHSQHHREAAEGWLWTCCAACAADDPPAASGAAAAARRAIAVLLQQWLPVCLEQLVLPAGVEEGQQAASLAGDCIRSSAMVAE